MSYVYSDVDSRMRIRNDGNPVIHYDEDAIIQSIKNLLSTVTGERVRNPIGSSLIRTLFESISTDAATDIRQALITSIQRYEPRVTIKTVQVTPLFDQNRYEIVIDLRINSLNDRNIRIREQLRTFV